MQGQQSQQQAVTAKQSLLVVQTLLRVSFGCVAYLRDLLPDDNFIDGYLTAAGGDSFSQQDGLAATGQPLDKKPPYGALKVKTIRKDFSTEGDKLIQYLEEGIFDALEKQYLRSFIFAVYLDDQDPENIVEAYTFNFSYHDVPGSTSKVPIMTLGERFKKMSLDTRSVSNIDPAAEAIMNGKAPTLGQVKKSVKNLMKTLLTSLQLLHALPKRRFGTFKLFYVDNVPDDYEPPHFTAGNAKNKYFFTTHTKDETPEKMSVGSLRTPYHGIELHVASVSDAIPRGDDDTVRFGDLVNQEAGPYSAGQSMTMAENAKLIHYQKQDALLRKVVWDAEVFANPDGEVDAEGEEDPEYKGPWDNILTQKPRGVRYPDGTIREVCQSEANESAALQAYSGKRVDEPDGIKFSGSNIIEQEIPSTQIVESTQCVEPGSRSASINLRSEPVKDLEESMMSRGIDTQLVQRILEQQDMDEPNSLVSNIEDSEMLNLETQLPLENYTALMDDPIASYSSHNGSAPDQVMDTSQKTVVPSKVVVEHNNSQSESDAQVTECDCGVPEDEDSGACQCEGPCGRWLHIWCMGYHSVDDPRLPHIFYCFPCRLRNDPRIELLDSRDLTSEYISRFKDLGFFRRALKIVETHRPDNVTRFKELLGSEVSMAGQAWKRLEAEGFIAIQTSDTDEIGLLETRGTSSRKGKGKGKQRVRKNLKRVRYVPIPDAMTGKAFQDYFDPAKETSLLGMTKPRQTPAVSKAQEEIIDVPPEAIESQTQLSVAANVESQAQSETQFSTQAYPGCQTQPQSNISKRKNAEEAPKNAKRVKISVGLGISLED